MKRPRATRGESRRSVCPIACTLDLVGDKWTLLVVRDCFAGKSHFHEFQRSPEGIASNILADRLAKLTASGILSCKPSSQREGANVYALTKRGTSLFPVLVAIRDWGLGHIRGTKAHIRVPQPE